MELSGQYKVRRFVIVFFFPGLVLRKNDNEVAHKSNNHLTPPLFQSNFLTHSMNQSDINDSFNEFTRKATKYFIEDHLKFTPEMGWCS